MVPGTQKEERSQMSEPIPMFTCDWCGKEFPADPDTMTESGFSAVHADDEDPAEAWKGEPDHEHEPLTMKFEDAPAEMIEHMKSQMGLSDAECKELIETGHVEAGASCVCIECQDKALED
jgi:hypothetical protein